MDTTTTRKFSPLMPMPIKFDVAARLQTLRRWLDPSSPHYQPEGQHLNIRKLIELYETGQKTDNVGEIWLLDGKVVSMDEACNSPGWAMSEVRPSNPLDENAFN